MLPTDGQHDALLDIHEINEFQNSSYYTIFSQCSLHHLANIVKVNIKCEFHQNYYWHLYFLESKRIHFLGYSNKTCIKL